MRIVVASPKVSVFVEGANVPRLIVSQLSARGKGLIGIWGGNNSRIVVIRKLAWLTRFLSKLLVEILGALLDLGPHLAETGRLAATSPPHVPCSKDFRSQAAFRIGAMYFQVS